MNTRVLSGSSCEALDWVDAAPPVAVPFAVFRFFDAFSEHPLAVLIITTLCV